MLRKQIIPASTRAGAAGERRPPDFKDVPAIATVLVTSESPEHPVDHLFDGQDGPGGTRWIASVDGAQELILAFDAPQTIREVRLESEEPHRSRTQVVTLSLSRDGGNAYREILRQEFNFSSPGTTVQRETWNIPAEGVTHLRLVIEPDKGGLPCRATLTSLAIR